MFFELNPYQQSCSQQVKETRGNETRTPGLLKSYIHVMDGNKYDPVLAKRTET